MKRNKIFGLDLLKTIAIVAIVIYHLNAAWLPGGFIGVDLFFVISGYLLASSFLRQDGEGRFSLFKNIFKRIKNLWPPLFIVVFFVTIFITMFNKPILDIAHRDIFPSLTFTNNWWFIINKVGYFDSYFQSPFKHLWYISVLMQAYIILNILFYLTSKLSSKNNYRLFRIIILVLGIISFVVMQVLYDPENVSRVYYGTDTRIFEIIIGVLAYFHYPIRKLRKEDYRNNLENYEEGKFEISLSMPLLALISVLSLAAFVVLGLYVSEEYTWVYRGGFLLFALLSVVMVYTLANDNNPIFNKFRYIPFIKRPGEMSYSIYLWHFPIIILSETQSEINGPNTIYVILRVLAFLILSAFTYYFMEKPLAKERKSRPKSRREREKSRERKSNILVQRIALGLAIIFILGAFGIGIPFISTAFVDTTRNIDLPDELVTDGEQLGQKAKENDMEIIKPAEKEESPKEPDSSTQEEINLDEIKYDKIVLIGDSLGVNVGLSLKEKLNNVIVDAKVSRQLYQSEPVFAKYAEHDSENTALIMMLGTNGLFNEGHLDKLMVHFPKSKKVFVNVNMPDSWRDKVNQDLAAYVEKHPEISLVDWYSNSKDHPEYFAKDKTHLNNDGIDVMINLIAQELKK